MIRARTLALLLTFATAPLAAQSFTSDLHQDLNAAQKKIVDLFGVLPENTLDWRPKGDAHVRSTREVYLHIISENYYLGGLMGKEIPAATGITADYKTVEAYEKKPMTKAQITAELTPSFTFLHQALGLTKEANAGEKIKFFGQDMARSTTMVSTVTHMHEHLGQLIAYARSNGVTPPWSK